MSSPDPLEALDDTHAIIITVTDDDDRPEVDTGDMDENQALGLLVKAVVALLFPDEEEDD